MGIDIMDGGYKLQRKLNDVSMGDLRFSAQSIPDSLHPVIASVCRPCCFVDVDKAEKEAEKLLELLCASLLRSCFLLANLSLTYNFTSYLSVCYSSTVKPM